MPRKRIEFLEFGNGFRISLVGGALWTGTSGADSAVAGSGNNNLSGGACVDYVHGGSGDGNDFLWGGAGGAATCAGGGR